MRFIQFFIAFLVFAVAQGQEKCGHTAYIDYLETQEPGIKDHIDKVFNQSVDQLYSSNKVSESDTIYTVQVVVHIVYNNNLENLSDELVESQLRVLNECFRRTTPDTVDTRAEFLPVAADTRIQFELASVDPNGQPTNGIIRQETGFTSFMNTFSLDEADRVKLVSRPWDTKRYLNIWVCDLSLQGNDRLLGYAYPPVNAPHWNPNSSTIPTKEGVVVHYKVFGENNPLSLGTGAKTAVHEVGHYLGLRHIWGDAPNGPQRCNTFYDDGLADTPLSGTNSDASTCNFNKNTCGFGNAGDLKDQVENYMDYSPGRCQNMFTADQGALMRSNIRWYRSEVVTNKEYPAVIYTETKMYPNPSISNVIITIADADAISSYHIEFVNMLGQMALSQPLEPINYQTIVNDQGLRGAYYFRIIKNEEEVLLEGKQMFID